MARPKLGEGDTQRLQLKISEEELTAIDDWRFANRIASRSEAVRRLCQIAVASDDRIARLKTKTEEMRTYAYESLETLSKTMLDAMSTLDLAGSLKEAIDIISNLASYSSDLDREASGAAAVSDVMKGDEKISRLIENLKTSAREHEKMMKHMPLKLIRRSAQE